MTQDDMEELARRVGIIKTKTDLIKPLWTASDRQLMDFSQSIIANVKQNASEFMVRAIKKAVEYEREQCAKVAEIEGMTQENIARVIRERDGE
jgi:chloramphenicol O-acetyltransferase